VSSSVFYLLGLAAGTALAVQVAVNSQLRAGVGSPMVATLFSFAVGTAAALAYCLAVGGPWPSRAQLGVTPWWSWGGGLLGLFYLWCSVVVAPRLGVAPTLGLVVAGQLATATLIDHFGALGTVARPVSLGKLAGLALIAVGVGLVAAFRE
jgi:transporter family-2 protein